MKPETTHKIKYGGWGLFCGAVIAMILGFGWGGWTTAHTTEKMSAGAVRAYQAEICVAQFMNDVDHVEKLKSFEKISSWDRTKFVEMGGWDKMPGQEEADYSVNRACSDKLELLIKN
jgi:predicted negative regulator of RcsB-dependent stress response